jgi:DNA topoisomerase IA
MNIKVKKYQLIEQMMHLDKDQIKRLENFFAEVLEPELSASLDKAIQQVEEGKVSTHNEVRKKYEKWL